MRKTSFSAAIGFVCCLFMIITGIATNGGIGTIPNFIHIPSMIITFGGAFFSVMITTESASEFIRGLKSIKKALFYKPANIDMIGNEIFDMAMIARKEGLLSLEEQSDRLEDAFFHKGIRLVIDGTDPELVKDILETEMMTTIEQSRGEVFFWEQFGAFSPAWGMVGTLLGLINMMKTMGNDSSAIGAGMSLALITTLYGSVMANWVCLPVAAKLRRVNAQEQIAMELTIEGILSIQAGDNPMVIKEKIRAFRSGWEEETEGMERAA